MCIAEYNVRWYTIIVGDNADSPGTQVGIGGGSDVLLIYVESERVLDGDDRNRVLLAEAGGDCRSVAIAQENRCCIALIEIEEV